MALPSLPTAPADLKWAKWLVRNDSLAMSAYEALFGSGQTVGTAPGVVWMRLNAVFRRTTPVGSVEDVAVCTFDLLNVTSGNADATWNTSDFTTAESKFDTMFTALMALSAPVVAMKEYRWYRKTFAAPGAVYTSGKPKYFNDSGPPVRVTPKNIPGTLTGTYGHPYQVAISITEKTALPKHWGRFYMPNPGEAIIDSYGRISAPQNWRDPVVTAYAALADAELFPVVASGFHHACLSVTQIQVDDVPDVQRRRRAKTTLVRSVAP